MRYCLQIAYDWILFYPAQIFILLKINPFALNVITYIFSIKSANIFLCFHLFCLVLCQKLGVCIYNHLFLDSVLSYWSSCFTDVRITLSSLLKLCDEFSYPEYKCANLVLKNFFCHFWHLTSIINFKNQFVIFCDIVAVLFFASLL